MSLADSYILLHQHPTWELLHWAPHPSPGSTAQRWVPWALTIHSGHKTMLRLFLLSPQREIFHPCKESVLPLAFLLSAILIPSCSWVFLPSVSDHSSVKLPLPIIISPSLEIDASRQDLPKIVHPTRSKIKSNTKISSLLECHLLD